MNIVKQLGQFMLMGARAHAQWELDTSKRIIRSPKRLAILGLLCLPIMFLGIAYAEEIAGVLPATIGGKTAYTPAFYTPTIFFASIGVGLCAGLITGCIGAGGGFIIAPALMSAGVKGILAVGTDLFHIFAKAIMGSVLHRKLGNISVGLALWFILGSMGGATLGGTINRALYDANPVMSDAFITSIYVFMLGFLSFYSLMDFFKARRAAAHVSRKSEEEQTKFKVGTMTGFAQKLQSMHIPPMIHFDQALIPGGRKISAWFLILAGAFVGLAAAIMGVGGGFLTFPIFVYSLGVSSATTVGTDIFQIIFTAGYAGLGQYAIYGFIFYTLAMGMLLGSLIGIQLGSLVTKVVPGQTICGFYATAVMAGFMNRAAALPIKLSKMGYINLDKETGKLIESVGIYAFFVVISVFSLWVLWTFLSNIKTLKGETPNVVHGKEAHA